MEFRDSLLPDRRHLRLESVHWAGEQVVLTVSSKSLSASCPCCAQKSHRVHSCYERSLVDLPLQGKAVHVRWKTRRFRCDNSTCSRRIFSEQIPEFAARHARRTKRLTIALRALAMECGGEAGTRLADRLGMRASPATLLREIRRSAVESPSHVRKLGVDDWAIFKGHRYGTILVDLETRRAIDLLPDRSAESFATWLRQHPEVEIVSRDRGDPYVRGAKLGAPQAIQIADRWHLHHNVHEVLARVMERFPFEIGRAAQQAFQKPVERIVLTQVSPVSQVPLDPPLKKISQNRRKKWEVRYERVVELRGQNRSIRQIAREVKIDRGTIQRWLRAGGVPERIGRPRRTRLETWNNYLATRWEAGCRNAAILADELRGLGYSGSYDSVKRYVANWRSQDTASPEPTKRVPRPSPKAVAWWLLLPIEKRTNEQGAFVNHFSTACPLGNAVAGFLREFTAMLTDRKPAAFRNWVQRAQEFVEAPEVQRFAASLLEDANAIEAAMTHPWSNGQTEGQVNRLKLIKRKMYGRAKFDLLRCRVLAAST